MPPTMRSPWASNLLICQSWAGALFAARPPFSAVLPRSTERGR